MSALKDRSAVEARARAKVNLALHVTGRRVDGYHLLDTLVAFPDFGDQLSAAPSDTLSLDITGPFGAGLEAGDGNLVLKAAHMLAERLPTPRCAHLTLEKNLPVASGIGGGSADAAAALRLLKKMWQVDITDSELAALALEIGADVPMCLASAPLIARGIGDEITAVSSLPQCGIVLVNPGVAVATPAVFKALERRDNPPLPELPSAFTDAADLCAWLAQTRNDLEAPAILQAPKIADVLEALRAQPTTLLARMSGSGATCFALYATPKQAQVAATGLAALNGTWWVQAANLL
jgi:4-diphosphocytidyl-2-C-methyl-D-erythritol kinase